MEDPALFISAGDPSGDNAASRLAHHLKEKIPNIQLFGLGGKKLASLGQEQFAEPNRLAVMGFWEAIKNYFFFRKLFYTLLDEIKSRQPKAALLVDYPGFNLRLAKKINELGVPVIYYISPQVWAWGQKRVEQMRKHLDMMILILPFEEKFFSDSGINCKYVGHYLTEDIPDALIASDIPADGHIALLPGSREVEISRMLQPMCEAADLIYKKHKIKAVVAGITDRYDYEKVVRNFDNVDIVYDNSRQVVHDARVVITASGTATLETGIIGRPMVIVYKTGTVTYQIAKRVIKLDKIGLVNLVLNEKVVPELIQQEASGEALAEEVDRYLTDDSYYREVKQKLDTVSEILGKGTPSETAAELIAGYYR